MVTLAPVAPLLPSFTPDDSGTRVAKAVQAGGEIHVGPGSAGGHWRQLRGLPVIGRFTAGGAMFGSRPECEVLKLDRRKF
jgi:hypothetical protein